MADGDVPTDASQDLPLDNGLMLRASVSAHEATASNEAPQESGPSASVKIRGSEH